MYRAMYHHLPLVNGFSGHSPAHYEVLRQGLEDRDCAVLEEVTRLGLITARVDERRDTEGEWSRYVSSCRCARLGPRRGGERLFWLQPAPEERRDWTPAHTIALQHVSATPWSDLAPHMTDGDLTTRWSSEAPQAGGESVVVELWRVQSVSTVVLSLGRNHVDFPRRLLIETSEDGTLWSAAWRGSGSAPAFRAALRSPREIPMRFEFAPRPARLLRLRQTGTDPVFFWSIVELHVEGSGPPTLSVLRPFGVD